MDSRSSEIETDCIKFLSAGLSDEEHPIRKMQSRRVADMSSNEVRKRVFFIFKRSFRGVRIGYTNIVA